MIILHCTSKRNYEESLLKEVYGEELIENESFIHFSTWNSFYEIAKNFISNEEMVLLCVESDDIEVPIKWEDGGNGIHYPHMYGTLPIESIKEVLPFIHNGQKWENTKDCVHVLMNQPGIDQEWCYSILQEFITPSLRVCIFPFSFFHNVKNAQDWNKNYGSSGMWHASNMKVWKRFGISNDQIVWVNYFSDTKEDMLNKIMNSDILFLTGGAPDLMMERMIECGLENVIQRYQGIMLGYSAGAMVQLKDYHITPDSDYAMFTYEKGLSCQVGFDIEVHYTGSKVQHDAITKVQQERHVPIYALYDDGGLIIKNAQIQMFGHVELIKL